MTASADQTELTAWGLWGERCALGRLEESDRRLLTRVIADRFRSMVRKLNAHGGGNLLAPPEEDCAHWFETYLAVHNRRDGKKYKHWLLTRGRRDLDTIQSGVMLLTRNTVREWLRLSHPRTAEVSLDQEVAEGVTVEMLLPAEGTGLSGEGRAWMEERVRTLLSELTPAERAALQLRARGEIFSAPGVKERVGFGKTKLHSSYRELLSRLATEVKENFPGISPAEGSALVLSGLDSLGGGILSELSAENGGTRAFGEPETHHD